jgi:hypothetical protein
MLRTQIFLTETLMKKLKRIKTHKNKTLGGVIREILEENIEKYLKAKPNGASLTDLAREGSKGGPRDLSTRIDDYLYGDK